MRWGAIITIGLAIAAIIRASSKIADQFQYDGTEGDCFTGFIPGLQGPTVTAARTPLLRASVNAVRGGGCASEETGEVGECHINHHGKGVA